ncbi:aspartyl protease family protein [Spongiimicrobium salis]|uniref:aspartyl protease family protein n=1 Tax=Spongiimicrobium salis TaxID=1667022 RepID=UPI00374CA6BE
MKLKYLVLFILFFCLCANGQRHYQDTIPFKTHLGLITIPIIFNGIEKQFLFDTGASHSIGFSWVGKELKSTRKTINVSSSGGRVSKLRYHKSGKIELGSVKINKHRILKTRDSEIFSCYNIDGVLGVDIISEFNWTIDFKEKYLIMYPKTFVPESTQLMHPMQLQHKRRPFLILKTEKGKSVRFLLDTGATSSDINKKVLLDTSSENPLDYEIYSGSYDFNGKRKNSFLKVLKRPFTSEKVTINGVFDYGIQSSKIGNRLWKDNRLFLSENKKMFLVKNPVLDEFRSNYDCSFVFNDGAIIVGHVVVDSEAWEKGIRQGDEVKALNGKTFSNFCEITKYQRGLVDVDDKIIVTLMDNSAIELRRQQRF